MPDVATTLAIAKGAQLKRMILEQLVLTGGDQANERLKQFAAITAQQLQVPRMDHILAGLGRLAANSTRHVPIC